MCSLRIEDLQVNFKTTKEIVIDDAALQGGVAVLAWGVGNQGRRVVRGCGGGAGAVGASGEL